MDEQNQSEQNQDSVEDALDAAIRSKEKEPAEEHGGGNSNNGTPTKRKTYYQEFAEFELKDRFSIYLTAILVVLTGLTLAVFWQQLRAMDDTLVEIRDGGEQTERIAIANLAQVQIASRAAKAAEQQVVSSQNGVKATQSQMREDERAWIEMHITKPLAVEENKVTTIDVEVKNIGKTPARNVFTELIIQPRKIDSPPVIDFGDGIPRTTQSAGILYPNDPLPTPVTVVQKAEKDGQFYPIPASSQTVKAWKNGEFYVVVYGRTQFTDIFGVHHITRFCTYIGGKGGIFVPTRTCSDYNNVDNN